jgi:hypothetical protein
MEPLLLSVICGCNAGLLRDALRGVYIPRIQRRECLLLRPRFLEQQGHCFLFWLISSNRDAGYLPARHRLRDRRLQRFLDLVAFFHLAALQRERDPGVGPSMAQGMPTEKFLTLVLGLLSGAFFLGSA